MSVVYDSETDLEMHGAGAVGGAMPHGNKKAGYVGLLVAKHHLGRNVDDYENARPKKMARRFNIREMRMRQNPQRPSEYLEQIYGDQRNARVPLSAAQRANLREDAEAGDHRAIAFLAHIRQLEAERQQRRRQNRGAGIRCRDYEKMRGGFVDAYQYIMRHPNPESFYDYFN